jgi:hypothetical protein
MNTIRPYLIERLTNSINQRENAQLTHEQVTHYIGSDMLNETLLTWVWESESPSTESVTVADVMSLWEDMS